MFRSDILYCFGVMINAATKLKANHISFITVFSFSFISIIIFQVFSNPKRILTTYSFTLLDVFNQYKIFEGGKIHKKMRFID